MIKYRKRTIECYQEGHTLAETKKVFQVSISTIRECERRLREEGNLKAKKYPGTVKKIIPEEMKKYVLENPDAYQREMAEAFGCSEAAICKALKRFKITRKKRHIITKSRILKK